MEEELKNALSFVIEIDKMKSILRRSLTFDGSHYENDAEHSWHLAMMAIAFARYAARPVRLERVLKMTLVHDLVEIYAGDTFAYDKEANLDKEQREGAAADRIFAMIPEGGELRIRHIGCVGAVDFHCPARREVEEADDIEQSRFSTAGGAHDAEEFALFDGEIYIFESDSLDFVSTIDLFDLI